MEYIKKYITPMLIGFSIGIMTMAVINTVDDVIIKIILINKEK
jgi:hypothetical protein